MTGMHDIVTIINCGGYEISDGALGHAIGTFHRGKLYKLEGNKSLLKEYREITNFHLLHWHATKVVEKW